MTTFNKTITNTVGVFGGEATNLWGTMTWGQKWGYGNIDLKTTITKVYGNTLTLDSSIIASPVKVISNALIFSGDMSMESVVDSAGWYRIFGNSSNAENRPATSFTSVTTGSGSYTSAVNAGTIWS